MPSENRGMAYAGANTPPILYHKACLKFYQYTQGKEGHGLMMSEHVQRHTSLTEVTYRSRWDFSGMKGIVDFFADEVHTVANSKALTATEIPMAMRYVREV